MGFQLRGLPNGRSGKSRRDVHHTRVGIGFDHSLFHSVENWHTQTPLSSLSGGDTTDNLRSVLDCLTRVKFALFSSEPLNNYFGIPVYPYIRSGTQIVGGVTT